MVICVSLYAHYVYIYIPVSYQSLLYDLGGPNFIADDIRLAVGMHSLEITISTELGQVLSVPLEIIIPGLFLAKLNYYFTSSH